MKTYLPSRFIVERDSDRCIQCQVCVNQCTFDTHYYDAEDDEVRSRQENCVGCHRCVTFCSTGALTVKNNPLDYRDNYNWQPEVIEDYQILHQLVGEFANHFGYEATEILKDKFVKLFPLFLRPYGRLYAY